ncbi:hypothetical protein MMC21_000860 [Puttea exsequens]|nr:hypothetical protein [Puttea exsequens]
MSTLESSGEAAWNTRRLAKPFTARTPKHHPFLDPDFAQEDASLVPADLAPQGRLNWDLPRKTKANLYIMLKLSNEAEELLEEWHEKIPKIDDVLSEWAEMSGATPTTHGRMQLQAQARFRENLKNEGNLVSEGSSCVFNMSRNVDSPGQADVIYLTDAVDEGIPENIRRTEWDELGKAGFEGCNSLLLSNASTYIHQPREQGEASFGKGDSIPDNLRTVDWAAAATKSADLQLIPTVYTPKSSSIENRNRRIGSHEELGPTKNFGRLSLMGLNC